MSYPKLALEKVINFGFKDRMKPFQEISTIEQRLKKASTFQTQIRRNSISELHVGDVARPAFVKEPTTPQSRRRFSASSYIPSPKKTPTHRPARHFFPTAQIDSVIPPASKLLQTEVLSQSKESYNNVLKLISSQRYRKITDELLLYRPFNPSYLALQKKLAAYNQQMLLANRMVFATFGAKEQFLRQPAEECVKAMKLYQVFHKERLLLGEGFEERRLEAKIQKVIFYIEQNHFFQSNNCLIKKQEVISALQLSFQTFYTRDDIDFLNNLVNLLRLACEYEKLLGDHAVFTKVCSQISREEQRFNKMIDIYGDEFFTDPFGNDLLIERAFMGDPGAAKLHGLLCQQLNREESEENYGFLDRVRVFLSSLQSSYLRLEKSFTKQQMQVFFQEAQGIYHFYVDPQGEKPLNLTLIERQNVQMKFEQFTFLCEGGTQSAEDFYMAAIFLFQTAEKAIKKLNRDVFFRMRRMPDKKEELLVAILMSIGCKRIKTSESKIGSDG